MEVSPRGGGNRLAEMLRYATGVDLITACVRAAVGDIVENVEQKPYNGHWAEVILHADKNGIFQELILDASVVGAEVIEEDLWVKPGDHVNGFEGANDAIGTLVLKFSSEEELVRALTCQHTWLTVIVK